MSDDLAIPAFCIISPEDRKAAWARHDATHPKEQPMGEKSDQVRDLRIKRATKGRAGATTSAGARKETLRAMVNAVDAPKKANFDQALAGAQGRTLDAALLMRTPSGGPRFGSVSSETIKETGSLLAKPNLDAQAAKNAAEAGADAIDFTKFKHPVLAVACPDCKARAGSWCKRPSGHKAMDLHGSRKQAADVAWEKTGAPLITQVGPDTFVYDKPSAPAAAQPKETTMKTAANSKLKKPATKKSATRKPAAAKTAPKAKTSAAANARTPLKEKAADGRPDGLRKDSKQAQMIDLALRDEGATEQAICKELGWKKCRVTLKRVAEKIGAKLEGKKNVAGETVWFATMPKKA